MVRWIAATTVLALLLTVSSAQAAESTVINLGCSGTSTTRQMDGTLESEELTQTGLFVNLADRTVSGGAEFIGVVAHIDDARDPVTISFDGKKAFVVDGGITVHISGTFNRVTGAANLTQVVVGKDKKSMSTGERQSYGSNTIVSTLELVCKATNRPF
jgi:hypothetical protein